jgi:TonB family protein
MRLTFSNGFRRLIAALFMLSVCPSTPAQEPQIAALAEKTASSLSQSKLKTVAVFAFVGPDDAEVLGQKLADEFREALVKSAHGFRVEDLSQVLRILGENGALSASINDPDTAAWFLRGSEVDASVLGTVSNENGGLKISVQAVRVRDSHQISNFETSIPLSDDLKTLVGVRGKREFASWPRGGKNGYSRPSCISCPPAHYFGAALSRRIEGTVILEITVDEDGHSKHIRVTKALRYGLTQEAISTVQKWQFKPSTDPDGKPAAVRTTVEVTFHLY